MLIPRSYLLGKCKIPGRSKFPGRSEFLGKIWISRIFDFLGNETSREMWVSGKWFFVNVIFQEMWFLEEILFFRKFDLLGNVIFFWNVTSQEIWLPSKCDLPGSCWKAWVALVCQFPKNATSQKMLLPRNCDFLGSVTSWELWLPGNCDFPGKMNSIWHF